MANLQRFWRWLIGFLKRNWFGGAVVLIVTLAYFWPLIMNISTYSPGGDAMFNAWEMRRNQNCILDQGCPDYLTANIFYPHPDTMLYSETQLSAGLVTLPFYWLTPNPIFEYNLLTIISFFLSGWFMYLLAKRLSRGNELLSVVAGLVFAFAPIRIAAIYHLQNLSIFCLPLAVLLILRFFDVYSRSFGTFYAKVPPVKGKRLFEKLRSLYKRTLFEVRLLMPSFWAARWYLICLLLALLYVFFASWVQMIFTLMALGTLLLCLLLFRQVRFRPVLIVSLVIALAILSTLPLALEYIKFAKLNHAQFSFKEQLLYSSDLKDYAIPYKYTLFGKIYYALRPSAWVNSYNLDSFSYHGITLYAVAILLFLVSWFRRKRSLKLKKEYAIIAALMAIAVVGFIVSLGPLLKIRGSWAFHVSGIDVSIMLPWLLVDKLLPQLAFIRALGRASILVLFALCCLFALLGSYSVIRRWNPKARWFLYGLLSILILFETMPTSMIAMSKNQYAYNLTIPAAYRYIKSHSNINNIIILNADYDYPKAPIPMATPEQILWSSYTNRNIFDGYSGYEPPEYVSQFDDFANFRPEVIPKLKALKLDYVMVDKLLMKGKPWLNTEVASLLPKKLYEDNRYALYKVE